jgi:hypothetical protein
LADAGEGLDATETAEVAARLQNVTDASRCFLPAQEQRLIASLLPDIRDRGRARARRGITITKILDLGGDRFVLDDRQRRKQPDWTYR